VNINEIQRLVDEEGIVFVSYGGVLTQSLISAMTDALEQETLDSDVKLGVSSNIFTIFIELTQNMMNYSKSEEAHNHDIKPGGLIVVSKNQEGTSYFVHAQNIVSCDDKTKMEPKLEDITTLDKDEIRKKYKELRRSGRHTHAKGGGIGFYEIAKRCDKVSYDFKPINEDRYYFHIKTEIKTKEK
jgi:hypothetical protein